MQIAAMKICTPNFICAFFFLIFLVVKSKAQITIGQDTIKVMSYNLTNYGNEIGGCTNASNGPTLKNPLFKTIIKYVKPDILGVCEMNTNPSYATGFLNNVLNTDGITYFKRSNFQVEPSGTITSLIYFNKEKFTLAKQSYVNTSYRLVHHFRLYMNTTALADGDTLWLNVLACHLKAGTASSDVTDRANMATAVRNYLNSFGKSENCLMLGDFNVYRSSEAAFQTLTSEGARKTYQFLDPINRVGSWTANNAFKDVHTQCPIQNGNGCFAGGGLDDRFDFILMNSHLINDSAKIKYASGTYKAIGNDGQHYNTSIDASPTNTSAPAEVILALTKASDHLPVVAGLRINGTFITSNQSKVYAHSVSAFFDVNILKVKDIEANRLEQIQVYDMKGQIIFDGKGAEIEEGISIQLPNVKPGIYNIRIILQDGTVLFSKAIHE